MSRGMSLESGSSMLLSELPRVLRRRWYLAALGLALTAFLCFATTQLVPLRHSASASVLLLPPASSVPEGSNPYLGLGGLAAPTEVLARAMSGRDSLEGIVQAGGTGDVTVERDYASSAPLLLLDVEDQDAASAAATLDLVITRVEPTLDALQDDANVPKRAHIRSTVVTIDRTGDPVRKPQLRALLVAAAAGLGITLLGTAFADALILRRKNRTSTDSETPLRSSRRRPDDRVPAIDPVAPDDDAQATGSGTVGTGTEQRGKSLSRSQG